MKLTLFQMSGIAHTIKSEIELTAGGILRHPPYTPVTGYRNRGKRKQFAFRNPPEHDTLIFEGWDLPIGVDSDLIRADGSSGFHGNACINLTGDLAVIKDYVENRNLNELFTERDKAKILHCTADQDLHSDGVPVYPELDSSGHAVMDRIKEKIEEKALSMGIPRANLIVATC